MREENPTAVRRVPVNLTGGPSVPGDPDEEATKAARKERTMALKMATANRSSFSQNAKNKAAEDAVVKQLKDCAGVYRNWEAMKKRTVKSVEDYLAKQVPKREKTQALKVLCKKADIHLATYYRWKEEVEIAPVLDLAEKQGRTINALLRKAILEAQAENPHATAPEVFQKACTIADAPKATKAEIQPIQGLRNALAEYLDATNNDVQGVLSAVKSMNVPADVICKALDEVCK
jgi:hypothetical protein